VVEPALAGLELQWQRAEAADPLVGLGWQRRLRRPDAEVECRGPLHHQLAPTAELAAQAQAGGQQVAHGDGSPGRHRLLQRPGGIGQHPAVGQLGEVAVDRLVEPDPPVRHQDQRGNRGDRLGHRRDPEDGVSRHRHAGVDVDHAGGADVGLALAAHPPHQSGHLAFAHVRFDR
jgi:hypothetical protein